MDTRGESFECGLMEGEVISGKLQYTTKDNENEALGVSEFR